ncbi:MAG: ankyrin repeat domain-containing protein [Thermofilaceae archaeon]
MGSLHEAARKGDLQLVKKLVVKGADVNAKDLSGWTPLHYAAKEGHLEIVQFLVEKGASVNAEDISGWTPLHEAAYCGHLEIARFLAMRGANVNARENIDKATPLHYAAREGHLEVARLLIEKGANVNAIDKKGRTPLHYAVKMGHLEVARLLIEKGANVNARNNNSETPLHIATHLGYLEIVQLLLKAGADPTLQDSKGRTPLDLAKEKGHVDVVQLLEDWGKGVRSVVVKRTDQTVAPKLQESVYAGLIASVECGGLVEGEWGALRLQLSRSSRLVVEGDVEWLDPGEVQGSVEIPVKPRRSGKVPVAIVAKSGEREERKIIWIEVAESRRMKGATLCPNCWAPQEPDAKYCWRCGTRLVG